LWFNLKPPFFEQQENTAIISAERLSYYKRRYANHFLLYRRYVWSLLTNDISLWSEENSPLKIQIYAMEKSMPVFERGKKTWTKEEGERAAAFEYKYKNLLDGLKTEPAFHNFIYHLPGHPVLYSESPGIRFLWEWFAFPASDLMKILFCGLEIMGHRKEIFEGYFGLDLHETRASFIPFVFFKKRWRICWDVYPVGFDEKAYLDNEITSLDAIFMALIDEERAEKMLIDSYFKGGDITPYMSSISDSFSVLKKDLSVSETSISFFRLSDSTLVDFDAETILSEIEPGGDMEGRTIFELVDKVLSSSRSGHFIYRSKADSRDYLATVYFPDNFGGAGMLFSQPLDFLYGSMVWKKRFFYLSIFMAVFVSLIFGLFMGGRIIRPVISLDRKLHHILSGNGESPMMALERNDELGRLSFEFQRMSDIIRDKLFQMNTIRTLNVMLHRNEDVQKLFYLIISALCKYFKINQGFLGFYQGRPDINKFAFFAITEVRETFEKLCPFFDNLLPDSPVFREEGLFYRMEVNVTERIRFNGLLFMGGSRNRPDISTISSLCNQANTILREVWLNEIQKDNKEGRIVQEKLMPDSKPNINGKIEVESIYMASRGLAGDYFDYHYFSNDDYFGISIADVSGKGVGPALFGTFAKSIMGVVEHDFCNPGLALTELNHHLCALQLPGFFVTIFFAVFNFSRGELYYASAGHNDMLLLRGDGRVEKLGTKNLPAGFLPHTYDTKKEQISKGDRLFLYTDGVTELENPEDDLYGMERLLAALCSCAGEKPFAQVQKLQDDLKKFCDGKSPSDDITVIVAELK
jgi:serine phosphatase RsbU (regulator of sigma subunit)/HAMP domain-containing protein